MRSQNARLLSCLKRRSITPLEAWDQLGIYRLAARVRDLKDCGIDVQREMVEVENRYGERVRVARYFLV